MTQSNAVIQGESVIVGKEWSTTESKLQFSNSILYFISWENPWHIESSNMAF